MTTKETWQAAAREWRKMAARIDRGAWKHGGLCAEVNGLQRDVLRGAMRSQLVQHTISHAVTVYEVRNRLKETEWYADLYDCEQDGVYLNDVYLDEPGVSKSRVLFCLLLALEADEEAAL